MKKLELVISICTQQRNGALDALADQAAEAQLGREQVESRHELLELCIRSEKLPPDVAAKVMKDEAFRTWHSKRFQPLKDV